MTDIIKYIGGEICEMDDEPYSLNIETSFNMLFPKQVSGKSLFFLETGTDALAVIITSLKQKKVTLWVPENYCLDTIYRLKLKYIGEIDVKNYNDIKIVENNVKKLDIVVLLHFNAFDETLVKTITSIKEKGAVSIEDYVHAPVQLSKFSADYAFTSFRKFLAKEVALLYASQLEEKLITNGTSYYNLKKEAGNLKQQYITQSVYDLPQEEAYLSNYAKAEIALSNEKHIIAAQQEEIRKLKKIDFEKIVEIRQKNYQFLYSEINRLKNYKIIRGGYMYFMIQTDKQKEIRKQSFQSGIFPAIHWVDSSSELSKSLLSFHIDHRFSSKDLKRIVKIIKAE